MKQRERILGAAASTSLLGLVALCVAWELWLAPLRPQGSWLVLKVVPLLLALRGVLHQQRYTYQWSSMLILAYFAEGTVRAFSDSGLSARLAWLEIALASVYFLAAIGLCRRH